MRRKPSRSARAVALATVFCALGIASGCGREQFDLLSNESLVDAGRSGSGAGATSGGSSGFSGRAPYGGAGKTAVGGFGGRPVFPGGGFGSAPCLGQGGCSDEQPACPTALPFCKACNTNKECFESDICNTEINRCVQCTNDMDCVGPNQRCNPKTFRCAKTCNPDKGGCGIDQRSTCTADGLCVACIKDTDCNGYTSFDAHCYMNTCVECYDNKHCMEPEVCYFGYCTMR
jgi:hypothetical protein